jgi:hypothetical protein
MKLIIATIAMFASLAAFANPAIEAAAMESEMIQHPDRRAVVASTILGLENTIPDQGLIPDTIPAPAPDVYPEAGKVTIDEGYPSKN